MLVGKLRSPTMIAAAPLLAGRAVVLPPARSARWPRSSSGFNVLQTLSGVFASRRLHGLSGSERFFDAAHVKSVLIHARVPVTGSLLSGWGVFSMAGMRLCIPEAPVLC